MSDSTRPLGHAGLSHKQLARDLNVSNTVLKSHYNANRLPRPVDKTYSNRELARLVYWIDLAGLTTKAPWAEWARREPLADDGTAPVYNGAPCHYTKSKGTPRQRQQARDMFAALANHLGTESAAVAFMRVFAGFDICIPDAEEVEALADGVSV